MSSCKVFLIFITKDLRNILIRKLPNINVDLFIDSRYESILTPKSGLGVSVVRRPVVS